MSTWMMLVGGVGAFTAEAAPPQWIHEDGAAWTSGEAHAVFSVCQASSRRVDAEGVTVVVWDLVASCIEAEGVRWEGGPREVARWTVNRWVPERASCVSAGQVAAWAHVCRVDAIVLDRDGAPIVDDASVASCMAEGGLVSATPRAFVSQQEACGVTVAAR